MVEKPVVTVDYREANTARFNKLYTGGQHARCIAIFLLYMRIYESPYHAVVVSCGIRRAVQQALTPSKRKDGRLWKENRRLLSKSGEKMFADAHRGCCLTWISADSDNVQGHGR